jgi:hypothetical protein
VTRGISGWRGVSVVTAAAIGLGLGAAADGARVGILDLRAGVSGIWSRGARRA